MHPVLRKFSKRRPRTYGLILLALGAVLAKFGQWGAASSIPSLWVAMVLGIVFGILGIVFLVLGSKYNPDWPSPPDEPSPKEIKPRAQRGAYTFHCTWSGNGEIYDNAGKILWSFRTGPEHFFIQRTACSTFPISSSMTPPSESSSESGENAGSRLNL